MRVKDVVGRFGEQVAAEHLAAAGLVIVERNWRCREGELDIVAEDPAGGGALVFVEVKTRSSTSFGVPAQAVDAVKAARIRVVATRWLAAHREGGRPWPVIRFDVVAVLRTRSGLSVEHVRGAF